jgi:uncharacterized membrane protein
MNGCHKLQLGIYLGLVDFVDELLRKTAVLKWKEVLKNNTPYNISLQCPTF